MLRPSNDRRPLREPGFPTVNGFTIVELMITIAIGLFLALGLLTLVGAMKRTSVSQSGLSQLQDNERLVMTLMNDVIQSAGFYPDPTVELNTTAFPAVGSFAAGQVLYGTGAYAAGANTISLRYNSAGNDNVINCAGAVSTVAAAYTATFQVDSVNNLLNCVLTTKTAAGTTTQTIELANNIADLKIYYGVKTNSAVTGTSIDAYLDANGVQAGPYWNKVISVKAKVVFNNPLAGQPGQTSTTIPFERVITVMNQAGGTT